MEQNPYESPRVPTPQTPHTVVRRAIGVAAILMLTPLAVLIAFGGSCLATRAFANSPTPGLDLGSVIAIAFSIFLIPPAAVLIGMIWWAVRTHSRAKADAAKARLGELAGDSLNALVSPGAADESPKPD